MYSVWYVIMVTNYLISLFLLFSDDSEDELLIELKKKKRGRKPGSRNGEVKEIKRGRKKKEKHVNWDLRAKVI